MSRRKRFLDLALSLPAATVTLPFVVLLALMSAMRYRSWPFFTQLRVGRHGHLFKFLKIRTLPPHFPAYADKYSLDEREISRFGSLLRKTHLDEIPQLWLVLAGRMSLVGPRPEMEILANSFDQSFASIRVEVSPGCTGLWQISTDADRLIGEVPEYDLYYISRASARLDLKILLVTLCQTVATSWLTFDATKIRDLDSYRASSEVA